MEDLKRVLRPALLDPSVPSPDFVGSATPRPAPPVLYHPTIVVVGSRRRKVQHRFMVRKASPLSHFN